jgi:hypothetical protein
MRYFALLLVASACQANDPTYFPGTKTLEVNGMPSDPTMMASSVDLDTFTLPFRPPNAAEQQTLMMQSAQLGFQAPWLTRTDIAIEISYVIKNVDTMPGTARVAVWAADEFTNYDLSAMYVAQAMMPNGQKQVIILPLIQGIPVMIDPGKTYEGIVREDDFAEAELDLDAMGRWMAIPAEVLINRSEVNPIGLEMVPKNEIVPAIFQTVFQFEADVHMTCTYVIRVRDLNDRLETGPGTIYAPMPTNYVPPPPIMMGN